MSNINTKGKKYSKNISIPLIYSENSLKNNESLKIIFAEEGTIITEENKIFKTTSPAILVLNRFNSIINIILLLFVNSIVYKLLF